MESLELNVPSTIARPRISDKEGEGNNAVVALGDTQGSLDSNAHASCAASARMSVTVDCAIQTFVLYFRSIQNTCGTFYRNCNSRYFTEKLVCR